MSAGLDAATAWQAAAVVDVVAGVLGDELLAVHLHGSAVAGGLRPSSDLDLLVEARRTPDPARRRALVRGLLPLSGRAATVPGRPIELTVVARDDVVPWRHPAVASFQYGEWLREEYEHGLVPAPAASPDLAVLLATTLAHGWSLHGPPPADLLGPVAAADVVAASVAGVPELLDDLAGDERNVLLTLARVLTTLDTGCIVPKDTAADHAASSLGPAHGPVLRAARDDCRSGRSEDWPARHDEVLACATALAGRIAGMAATQSTKSGVCS